MSAPPRGAAGRETPIERATLLKIAKDAAQQRLKARPSLLSAYVIGSVAADEPLLGGATDIDLVLIDGAVPAVAREVVRLTDQVALDIQYRHRDEYTNPKLLRVHPWRGPEMAEPLFLLDPTHFFELAQSSARGQFHRPEYVATRARTFLAWARGELHIGLLPGAEPEAAVSVANWCNALLYAANAAIVLTGFPGAGRRLVLKLEGAAGKLKRPDLHADFLALFGGDRLERATAEALLVDWLAAYRAGQSGSDELIHPARRTLYERGFRAQIQADRAAEALWLMLATWNALHLNAPNDAARDERWLAFLAQLGLAELDSFDARVQQAVDYVSAVDVLVEGWAEQNGA